MISQQQRPLHFVVGATQRDPDGLALSSRNRYLSAEDRENALSLSRAIETVREVGMSAGNTLDRPAGEARAAGIGVFERYPLVRLDYLDLVDPGSFQSVSDDYRGPAIVIVAAKVGTTRLIDTDDVHLG